MKKAKKSISSKRSIKKIEKIHSRTYNRGTTNAVWSAKFLFKEIFENNRPFLKPSFIYALCSIIEENFNSVIIDFFEAKFGEEYKSYAAIFIKLSIHDKISMVVPVISNFKYQLNTDNSELRTIR